LFCFVVRGFVLSLFSEALWNLVASHSRTGKDQHGESGQHKADFEVILFCFHKLSDRCMLLRFVRRFAPDWFVLVFLA